MDEQEMKKIMAISVGVTVQRLTDLELAALNIVVQLDMNPHSRLFDYEKVKGCSLKLMEHGHMKELKPL